MLVHVYVHVLPCAAVLYKANLTRWWRSGVVAEPKNYDIYQVEESYILMVSGRLY